MTPPSKKHLRPSKKQLGPSRKQVAASKRQFPALRRPLTGTEKTTSRRIRQLTTPLTQAVSQVSEQSRPVLTRVLRPVLGRLRWVSPLGRTILALGLLCWLVGARWGWTELLMVAAAALVLFLACVLLALGRTRVRIEAEVDPRRVVVGEPATGRIAVTNDGRVPMLPLLVELPVGRSAARFVLPALTSGSTHDELFVVPTHRRGVIQVGPATTVQGDPLGLLRRTLTWTEQTELFVHPRTVPLETLGAGLIRDLEGATTEDVSMSDLAFHALRDYAPGDDRRYIHWRSSAKAGRLLIRQFLDTRRSHVCVIVDAEPQVYRDATDRPTTGGHTTDRHTTDRPGEHSADLETAISVGASIAVRVMLDEQECTVAAANHLVSQANPQIMLDTMARIEPAVATPAETGLVSVALRTADAAPDASTVFLVTGPDRAFIDVQRAAGQFPPEVRKVVIVVDPAERHSIRHSAGLTVLTLAELADLRLLLAAGVSA